jgi:hypothetical protein
MTTQELYILNFKTATWTQSWRTIQMLWYYAKKNSTALVPKEATLSS